MTKFQEFKLLAFAAYVLFCGVLVSATSYVTLMGWLE